MGSGNRMKWLNYCRRGVAVERAMLTFCWLGPCSLNKTRECTALNMAARPGLQTKKDLEWKGNGILTQKNKNSVPITLPSMAMEKSLKIRYFQSCPGSVGPSRATVCWTFSATSWPLRRFIHHHSELDSFTELFHFSGWTIATSVILPPNR